MRRPERLLLALGLALMLILPQAVSADEPAAPGDSSVVVKVHSPGAEPRSILRYQPAVGHGQDVEILMNMSMDIALDGSPMPRSPIPPMKMGMAIEIEEVRDNGDIAYRAKFKKGSVVPSPEIDPAVSSAMDEALGALGGIEVDVVVDARGTPKSAVVKGAETLPAQMRQTLDQMEQQVRYMSAPFPEVPVGLGAKWDVEQTVESGGMKIHQVASCALVSIDGEKLTLDITVKQEAEEQDLDLPTLPPGASAKLFSLESKGGGRMVVDKRQLAPVQSSLDMETTTKMEITAGGQTQSMSMEMALKAVIKGTVPKPLPVATPR